MGYQRHINKIKKPVADLRNFLDRHMGFILVAVFVMLGVPLYNLQADNRALLLGQEEQRGGRLAAVQDVTTDSNRNTQEILDRLDRLERLSCGILLLHDPNLEQVLPPELVELCQQELIDRTPRRVTPSRTPESEQQPQSPTPPEEQNPPIATTPAEETPPESGVLRFIPGVPDEPILGCPFGIVCI